MENHGIVIRLDGDHAIVEIRPPDGGCGRCHEAGGCGGHLLNDTLRPKKLSLYRLPNGIGAKPGDTVFIDIPEGALLRAALLAYLFPALMLILGAALGKAISSHALASLPGSAAGLAAALLILRLIHKNDSTASRPGKATPVMRPARKNELPARCQPHTP